MFPQFGKKPSQTFGTKESAVTIFQNASIKTTRGSWMGGVTSTTETDSERRWVGSHQVTGNIRRRGEDIKHPRISNFTT